MKTFIGIDPGLSVGFAVLNIDDTGQESRKCETLSFWEAMFKIHLFHVNTAKDSLLVVIEDPNLNRPTFYRPGTNQAIMHRISQNVGANKRDAQLIIEYMDFYKIKYLRVRPTDKKKNAEFIKKIAPDLGRTSQHARDAYMLIAGRK